ncbi:MAG: hypothetical protein LUH22_09470, partial [Bacteroides sp.]|nr:hypothetical protein [Bacteroides sp.]
KPANMFIPEYGGLRWRGKCRRFGLFALVGIAFPVAVVAVRQSGIEVDTEGFIALVLAAVMALRTKSFHFTAGAAIGNDVKFAKVDHKIVSN